MKRRLREETVIFISVLKWLILASIVGVLVGVSTTAFVTSLNFGAFLARRYPFYFALLPVGLVLTVLIEKFFLPGSDNRHGGNMVIEAVHKFSGLIKARIVPVEFIATWVTLTCGGSAGKEGPSAQIGAGLASIFSRLIRISGADRRKLVICGISSGFASVFGTPIAGALFGLEVLSVGAILYDVLLPSFVAGMISHQVSSWLGLTYFYNPVIFVPKFSESVFIVVILAGVFFGFCSFLFIETKKYAQKLSSRINVSPILKAAGAGFVLIVITVIFGDAFLGLGLDEIQAAIEGEIVPWYSFLVKTVTTSITLTFGGSGGIGTPLFFVGSTAGNFFGRVIGGDPALFAAIGFVSLLAGAANTPIAASIMAVELFGAAVAPYAGISCVISFVITGHRSAYPAQILAIKKSASIDVEIGKELEGLKPTYSHREKSLIGTIENLWNIAWRITSKK